MSDRIESAHERADGEKLIDRRTVTKAVMWSVPVVAAAVAVPLAAASTQTPQVNLWSNAHLPAGRDGTYAPDGTTTDYYEGPRACVFSFAFGNFGPDTLPAGATVTIGLPLALVWVTNSLTITNSGAAVLVPSGTRTSTIDQGPPLAVRQLWDFLLQTELESGASFTLDFTVNMNGSTNAASNYYRVRPTSNIQPGAGVTDTEPSNNLGFSDNYAFFNNVNAG